MQPKSETRREQGASSTSFHGLMKLRRVNFWLIPVVVILVSYAALVLMHRRDSQANHSARTRDSAIAYVSILEPRQEGKPETLTLPGKISAWYEAPIRTQVAGYVKSWSRDIGAIVKAGDVLAEIDTPELDERLSRAKEELSRANAALALARVTAERWAALRGHSAVSKQSADEKMSDARVKQADDGAAAANLERLKAEKLFARIVAPFDGVVTVRNIDIGSYVAPDRTSRPLFKVADIHEVRVYVDVPQIYSARLKAAMEATLTTPQWPGRTFSATIATTSNAIGSQSGSLLVELDRPNEDGALYPGSYADVHFELPFDPNQLRIASSALTFDEHGTRVATVDSDNRVRFKKVTVAKDFGAEVAIESGLSLHDRVIDNPSETLADGDEVHIAGAGSVSARK